MFSKDNEWDSILKSTNNSGLLFALGMGGWATILLDTRLPGVIGASLTQFWPSARGREREGGWQTKREREHSSCSSGSARKCFQCSKRKQLKHSPLLFCSERERHVELTLLPAGCLPHALPAAGATAARLLSGERTQVLVNSLAHKNAST